MEQSVAFIKKMKNPFIQQFFLLTKLPAAYFSGVRIKELSSDASEVTVPFTWFSKNPFRSIYFACLAMAAELSSGILALLNTYQNQPPVSMLVVHMGCDFFKKATGTIRFFCTDGDKIKAAIAETIQTGEGVTVITVSKGYNDNKDLVATFNITWSFKVKK
jgi:hypothetical protein